MVEYENRQPKEDINVSTRHPLKTFAIYSVSALILVVALVFLMHKGGGFIAKQVPFSAELRVIDSLNIDFGGSQESPQMVAYLNELAQRLLPHMDLPEGMRVNIHYNNEKVFNAFATLGGNLMFYRGLLELMPHENALAMVMAHEIAHVLHRDPAAGLGGGMASALVLAGLTGSGPAAGALSKAGVLTGMQFTRRMEVSADEVAVSAVGGLYGHTEGAADLFRAIATQRSGGEAGDESKSFSRFERFASTHPLDGDRIAAVLANSQRLGVPTTGELTPLPDDFNNWF